MFHIKPVLTIQGEKLDAFAKTRGMKKAKAIMLKALKEDLEKRFPGIDPKYVRIGAAGSGLSLEESREWQAMLQEMFPEVQVYYDHLSFSVGSHTRLGDTVWDSGLYRIHPLFKKCKCNYLHFN